MNPDDPFELPNGLLVCASHHLERCGICCVDYSFMREVLELDDHDTEEETEELYRQLPAERRAQIDARWGPPRRRASTASSLSDDDIPTIGIGGGFVKKRGTGRVFPKKFVPPDSHAPPRELFPASNNPAYTRFVQRGDPGKLLIYTDGACINNGQANPKGGWAFVFGPDAASGPNGGSRTCAGRLELKGPFGDAADQTSNRAELRAVIASLRTRHWNGEGYHTLVIATDSEYAVKGSTEWARNWVRNGWRTSYGNPVKNKDLWELLLGEIERLDDLGFAVEMWRIPRAANVAADRAAKTAAEGDNVPDFGDMLFVVGI